MTFQNHGGFSADSDSRASNARAAKKGSFTDRHHRERPCETIRCDCDFAESSSFTHTHTKKKSLKKTTHVVSRFFIYLFIFKSALNFNRFRPQRSRDPVRTRDGSSRDDIRKAESTEYLCERQLTCGAKT